MSDQNASAKALAQVQKKISAGELEAALADLDGLERSRPEDIDVLYLRAVACRFNRDAQGAFETLDRLKLLAPTHSRAHQEEGHLNRALGRVPEALAAYQRAVQLNPALIASVRAQLQIVTELDRPRDLVRLQAQLERLEGLPKELLDAMDLIAQGKLLKAETLCRRFLQNNTRDIEGMRLLADIGSRLGNLEDAEFLLESASAFEPSNAPLKLEYIQVLRKRQKFVAARTQAKALLDSAPTNPQFQSQYAVECMQTGDFELALSMFEQVLERVPGDPVTLTTQGHALKTNGSTEAAIESYRRAIDSRPEHGEAYYSLANLKTYKFSDQELERMHAQEHNSNLGHMERVYLCFAMAKAYEDRDSYDVAFEYYARGNQLKKVESRYDPQSMHDEMAIMREVCTTDMFSARAVQGCPAADPIFVLGLPRAGSTLLEQILSSHSQVDGTLELPNILSLSQRLRRRQAASGQGGYPHNLAELSAKELEEFGQEYIEQTRIHRQQAPFFVDKMPNNFRHIGLIKLILPNAKIIDARRDPMSCCFSGYKQLFAEGQEFTYSLTDVGRYYRDYVDLMAHWDAVLPGEVLRVQHEDVVDDLETQVWRILEFCNLPFEEACLRYYETERSVRTPSSEQVRQPIFRDSLAQWKNFEEHLHPLKDALGIDD